MKLPPRPDFERSSLHVLDGIWSISAGKDSRKYPITVPCPVESSLSGFDSSILAGTKTYWYEKRIENRTGSTSRVFLCCNAVDYTADVFIDEAFVTSHTGGYSYFEAEITDQVRGKKDFLIQIRVTDRDDPAQARGKQYWEKESSRCWYKGISGIWQSLWLEERPDTYIASVRITPDIDASRADFLICLNRSPSSAVSITVEKDDRVRSQTTVTAEDAEIRTSVFIKPDDSIDDTHLWSPENPQLYKAVIRTGSDEVVTYFGMRKIEVSGGRILLNNRPYYQRLVLDQAYFRDGILTAKDEDEYVRDIKLVKELGFNGVRLHQKIEDPRFYHLCDRMGLIVWLELPSMYSYSDQSACTLLSQWQDIILTHYNHPSITTYVPLNESWGVRNIYADRKMQEFSLAVYHLTKALDPTRLVSTNDGWEQTDSDIMAIHDYCQEGDELLEKLTSIDQLSRSAAGSRMLYAKGYEYEGQPVIVTEFGGIAFSRDTDGTNWGYGDSEKDEESFLRRLDGLIHAIVSSRTTSGFCYTQLTDVYQEVNGLLTSDRVPKCDIGRIRKVITQTPQ